LFHRGGDHGLHRFHVGRRRRAIVSPDDQLAHGAEADVRQQVDRDAVLREHAEVAVEVGPARRARFAVADAPRRDRIRLADHLRRDTLPDLALGVAVGDQRDVRVRVHVDEARREHPAARVDRPHRRCRRVADADDAALCDGDRAAPGGCTGPVDNLRVGDDQIRLAGLRR
jgi:hypothetical protein